MEDKQKKNKIENKAIKQINERIDNLERNSDNRINHIHWALFWFIAILWILFITALIAYYSSGSQSPKIENYYDNANTFCEHFNMTYDTGPLVPYRCINLTDDHAVYVSINQVGDRWVFTSGLN